MPRIFDNIDLSLLPALRERCTAPISLSESGSGQPIRLRHTPGISVAQLQRQLGIGCDTTAWHLLHQLRKALVNETRIARSGLIEADERTTGGPAARKRGRGVTAANHTSVVIGAGEVIAYENKQGKRCERPGRLRLSTVDHAGAVHSRDCLARQVEAGSPVRGDGWRGCFDKDQVGYNHRVRVVRTPERARRVAPHVHRVFSNLNAWFNGTQYGVEPRYLRRYLDKFVFRFNRRNTPMAAIQTLLGISIQQTPLPIRDWVVLSQP